jgi:D-arabinose 1-dehydrogenase-like Zn-dependent alcohol dehydrogenase
MKSYQLCECRKPLRLNERPTPQPKGSEVLLRVLAAGICHSDLHFRDGTYELGGGKQLNILERGVKLPLTLGHENVGEVVAVGPDVRGVNIGDRRLAWSWIGCSECKICERGGEHLCLKPRFLGAFVDGGYSTHLMLPHPRYLLDIGRLTPEQAAPLACAGITAFSALKKVDPAVLREEPVVIMSAGGLGLMALNLHQALGGRGAIVVELDAAKREAAKSAGAMAVVDPAQPDALERIKQLTNGGALAVVDFVGSGKTVQLGTDCLTKGGQVVIVGMYGGDVTLSTAFFPMRAMKVQGSYLGSRAEMDELLALVNRTGLKPVPVTARPMAEADHALDDLQAGKVVGRLVLIPPAA